MKMSDKTPMEQVLEGVPSARQMIDQISTDGNLDFPEAYKTLRNVEAAYEQLAEQGLDVAEQLKEKRYQIAEMAAHVMLADLENLVFAIATRLVDEDTLGDFFAGIEHNEYLPTLATYLKKIVPEWETSSHNKPSTYPIFKDGK